MVWTQIKCMVFEQPHPYQIYYSNILGRYGIIMRIFACSRINYAATHFQWCLCPNPPTHTHTPHPPTTATHHRPTPCFCYQTTLGYVHYIFRKIGPGVDFPDRTRNVISGRFFCAIDGCSLTSYISLQSWSCWAGAGLSVWKLSSRSCSAVQLFTFSTDEVYIPSFLTGCLSQAFPGSCIVSGGSFYEVYFSYLFFGV